MRVCDMCKSLSISHELIPANISAYHIIMLFFKMSDENCFSSARLFTIQTSVRKGAGIVLQHHISMTPTLMSFPTLLGTAMVLYWQFVVGLFKRIPQVDRSRYYILTCFCTSYVTNVRVLERLLLFETAFCRPLTAIFPTHQDTHLRSFQTFSEHIPLTRTIIGSPFHITMPPLDGSNLYAL
jgi:hypothetical protein